MSRSALRAGGLAAGLTGLAGCSGTQSVLDPAGVDAEVLADLFWVLLAGAVVLWILLNGAFFYVTRMSARRHSQRVGEALIIGAGIAFPTIVLAVLLSYGLSIMPDQRAPGDGLTVRVTGEQWWWRVEYLPEDGEPVVSANELRLPVGARTEIKLGAAKVIHSFWVPNLAGKMDMFPGRETRMAVEPTRTGEFRGQCAEFCGTSHALMAFSVVVMQPDDFAAWLESERADAAEPADASAARGREVFLAEGCGACHTVRGTPAVGTLGPDLTHVGGRRTIAAGTLPATAEAFGQWLANTDHIKPDVRMPTYRDLAAQDLADLAQYLKGLP
ncbi:cytochrome c oxidase subunit II [Thalassobaculum sp. OXR-137]|uniref:cytochrome c oxidase subunit II n=1 Tax=Thalassobaculum sp. OXR-137 TaxID=3100173 RepID=UPI002AC8A64A|nr:cytochrome c oxidase subunit II [Thalassobaculum sp. OXR-137]WPZ34408.1 cytochrome c oxidase subunit II [Thalassobaculum sp. OXR-137]